MVRVITYSDPTRKCPMLDNNMGYTGAIGGMYVICIWGVQWRGDFSSKLTILRKSFHVLRLDNSKCRLYEEHLS